MKHYRRRVTTMADCFLLSHGREEFFLNVKNWVMTNLPFDFLSLILPSPTKRLGRENIEADVEYFLSCEQRTQDKQQDLVLSAIVGLIQGLAQRDWDHPVVVIELMISSSLVSNKFLFSLILANNQFLISCIFLDSLNNLLHSWDG